MMMMAYRLLLLLLSIIVVAGASSAAVSSAVNGWYDCSAITFESELHAASNASDDTKEKQKKLLPVAECALIETPLCHDGVCKSKQTIQLFVKRILAQNPKQAPDVWFIQGGPGASSEAMEFGMQNMFQATNGAVNVYTVDHRGTGRSNKLDCTAAQATTSGSPGGQSIMPEEFPACSADLVTQYGEDLSAFSITSAAVDLGMLISGLQSSGGTFVYGVSYGTALVERLMHLKVSGIVGYVLDGVATSSGAAPADRFEYFSTWDIDFGAIGDRFLDLCKNDQFCNSKFGSKGPAQTLKDLYERLDSSVNGAACTSLPVEPTDDDSVPAGAPKGPVRVSFALRRLFGTLLQDSDLRTLIPALIYRMDRCKDEDKKVLGYFFNTTSEILEKQGTDESAPYQSNLLYQLITFSELWEMPPPSLEDMQKRFTDQLITNGAMFANLPANCLYRLDTKSPACRELGLDLGAIPSGTFPIAYKRDDYWNSTAKVPDGASVLIMNGKLDPQTHYRYAQYLYDTIIAKDSQKKLLLFEYLSHGTAFLPQADQDIPCGMQVLVSYVVSGGQLSALETSCMSKIPAPSFQVDPQVAEKLFGTSDVYSGNLAADLDKASSGSSSSGTNYKTLFIVFACLLAVAAVVIGFLVMRARNAGNQPAKDVQEVSHTYMEVRTGAGSNVGISA